MLRKLAAALSIVVVLALGLVGVAYAANPPGHGQPNQSCEEQPASPGNASGAGGSAFNPDGVAGGVYADGQHSNPVAVSQYDVACFQVSSRG
jgi:hypothetical protein